MSSFSSSESRPVDYIARAVFLKNIGDLLDAYDRGPKTDYFWDTPPRILGNIRHYFEAEEFIEFLECLDCGQKGGHGIDSSCGVKQQNHPALCNTLRGRYRWLMGDRS